MSCYNIERKIYELRNCGCSQCRREYDELMYRGRGRGRDYYEAPPSSYITASFMEPPSTRNAVLATAKDYKVEIIEPKDIAVKLILDRFKAEQGKLTAAETSIKSYKDLMATHNKAKSEAQKNLKELGIALKKLGHKEETK